MNNLELQKKADEEIRLLTQMIGKKVTIHLFDHGKTPTLTKTLLNVCQGESISVKDSAEVTSHFPFVGLGSAIIKITSHDGKIILFKNDTKFPEEWSIIQMNQFREEKWGTSKYNNPRSLI